MKITDPLGYLDFIGLLARAKLVRDGLVRADGEVDGDE